MFFSFEVKMETGETGGIDRKLPGIISGEMN
jgi:hypothetical protein